MGDVALRKADSTVSPHPNEFYRRRIERALAGRKRYKYVEPKTVAAEGGYRIESPCCSRNIDPEGGVIAVALLTFAPETDRWTLHRYHHANGLWQEDCSFDRLSDLLDHLNTDPERKFWQ
jgi:hypothetical protein